MTEQKDIVLSVIFPLLDASEDVAGVFQAVADQTGVDKKSIEIIVIDDGSHDDTLALVEKHRHLFDGFAHFSILKHPKREGLARTRLDGVTAARGTFITFCDKRLRHDPDFLHNLLNKHRNIVVGNPYMDKTIDPWNRVLALLRKKLYYPYFNHAFKDFDLDRDTYRHFKLKGGGGAMLVRRDYYLKVAEHFKTGLHVNDDSMFIENLLAFEPLLKTASAKTLYINRTGFSNNVSHLYDRGPKFVDYYIKPGTRFFPMFIALTVLVAGNLAAAFWLPVALLYELAGVIIGFTAVAAYLSENLLDFVTCLWLFPIIFAAFVSGILKGLAMKALRLY